MGWRKYQIKCNILSNMSPQCSLRDNSQLLRKAPYFISYFPTTQFERQSLVVKESRPSYDFCQPLLSKDIKPKDLRGYQAKGFELPRKRIGPATYSSIRIATSVRRAIQRVVAVIFVCTSCRFKCKAHKLCQYIGAVILWKSHHSSQRFYVHEVLVLVLYMLKPFISRESRSDR